VELSLKITINNKLSVVRLIAGQQVPCLAVNVEPTSNESGKAAQC
jgi:hypothetical protein